MRKFSQLIESLESKGNEADRIEILRNYFSFTEDKDKMWSLFLLTGGKVNSKIKLAQLREWAMEYSNIPGWMFDESLKAVGDVSETISLIIPANEGVISNKTITDRMNLIKSINKKGKDERKKMIAEAWGELSPNEIYIFNKILTGGFKSIVSHKTISAALNELEKTDPNIITYRLLNIQSPDTISYDEFIRESKSVDEYLKPYPFADIKLIEASADITGEPTDLIAEWKYYGIRCQVILKDGELFIWTEDGDLITNKFPEFEELKFLLPNGIVFEGELISHDRKNPMPSELLEKRLSRKNVTRRAMIEAPVVFMIHDVLEFNSNDTRSMPFLQRREIILNFKKQISNSGYLKISEEIDFPDWDELNRIRKNSGGNLTDGIILKTKDSVYPVPGKEEGFLLWKNDLQKISAVLIYAQKGSVSNTDLFCEYTFGLWDIDELVTIVKSNTGLSETEIKDIDLFVKNNTLEKFGPVRTVKPELVFEITFDGVAESKRHKSGVMLRSSKILKWRKDLNIEDADSMESLRKFMK